MSVVEDFRLATCWNDKGHNMSKWSLIFNIGMKQFSQNIYIDFNTLNTYSTP